MIRLAAVFLFLSIGFTTSAQVIIDKIVAVIGDQIVLKSDVEIQVGQMRAETPNLPEGVRCQVLDQLMMQKLLVNQAEVDSVTVSEDQVDAELNNRMRYFINMMGSQEKLEAFYNKSVVEIKEEYREEIEQQLIANKIRSQITSDVSVTPDDVKSFFENIPQDSLPYYNAEVQVGQIVLFAEPTEKQQNAAYEQIKDIRKDILSGSADFETKAILYSDDPGTASKGGELPEFTRDDPYAPEFIGAAFSLKEGEISEPFKTEFGYHILELMYRRGQRVKVRHILIKPDITSQNMKKVKEKGDSILSLVKSGRMSFPTAAGRYSDDENTNKYGGLFTNPQTGDTYFEIDQLGSMDREIPFIIDTMSAGEFSAPVEYSTQRGNKGYRIIYLKSVSEPHQANLDQDYAKIQQAALAQKKDKVLREWMKERMRKTYIRIEDSYVNCDNLDFWKNDKDLKEQ